MKYLVTFVILTFYGAIITGCNKNTDYTPGTDHTAGIVASLRWSGTVNGNCLFDSSWYDTATHTTKHITWAKHYSRTITDSVFAVQKINDFTVSALGYWMRYRTTDSSLKTVNFDTTYTGAVKSFIKFHYDNNSAEMEIHKISGYNSDAGLNYEDHWFLHTVN